MRVDQDEAPKGAPEWMVTFADLMSLLLTFFVLLLSFSTIEIEKFKTLSGSIRSAFGLRSELDISNTPMGSQILPKPSPSYDKMPAESPSHIVMVKLRKVLEGSQLRDRGTVEVKEEGVALRLAGDAVFEVGKADLKPAAYELLDELVEIATTSAGRIEVEGHTDDVPISTPRFPSNWELSSGRAGAAARYLVSRGVPASRIRAVGFADTRPLVPNDSPANRAKNRRVEFMFLPEEKGSQA